MGLWLEILSTVLLASAIICAFIFYRRAEKAKTEVKALQEQLKRVHFNPMGSTWKGVE